MAFNAWKTFLSAKHHLELVEPQQDVLPKSERFKTRAGDRASQ